MEPIEIGIAVSIGLLIFVILGMRVAFAAAIAGVVGLIWIFWAKKGYTGDSFLWALTVASKTAGQVPHQRYLHKHCLSFQLLFLLDIWPIMLV